MTSIASSEAALSARAAAWCTYLFLAQDRHREFLVKIRFGDFTFRITIRRGPST